MSKGFSCGDWIGELFIVMVYSMYSQHVTLLTFSLISLFLAATYFSKARYGTILCWKCRWTPINRPSICCRSHRTNLSRAGRSVAWLVGWFRLVLQCWEVVLHVKFSTRNERTARVFGRSFTISLCLFVSRTLFRPTMSSKASRQMVDCGSCSR